MAELIVRQRRANSETRYRAAKQPLASFGDLPFIDFWTVLNSRRDMSIRELHDAMLRKNWRRPQGGKLSLKIMQVDSVSMCKNGFVERLSE